MDLSNIEGIKTMDLPITGAELSEFKYFLQWMQKSIPDFTTRLRPFNKIFKMAYIKFGKRASKSIRTIY